VFLMAENNGMLPITVPIGPKFQALSGLGVTKQRELDAKGEIETVVAGGRRLVIVESYLAYLEREKAKGVQDARRNRAGAIPARGEKRHDRQPKEQKTSPN
jgi:hypothetical protein